MKQPGPGKYAQAAMPHAIDDVDIAAFVRQGVGASEGAGVPHQCLPAQLGPGMQDPVQELALAGLWDLATRR